MGAPFSWEKRYTSFPMAVHVATLIPEYLHIFYVSLIFSTIINSLIVLIIPLFVYVCFLQIFFIVPVC